MAREQAEDGAGQGGLAAARFTHQGHALAALHVEVEAVENGGAGAVPDGEAADPQQWRGHARLGSVQSRSASLMRVAAVTAAMMPSPGPMTSHGATVS